MKLKPSRISLASLDRTLRVLLRVGLGLAAFAVAFRHTSQWLTDNGITSLANLVTTCCIDILAYLCLRELVAAGKGGLMRTGYLLGFVVSIGLSLVAQIEKGANGHDAAGPALSVVPLAVFAYLTLMDEAERWRARRRPAPRVLPVVETASAAESEPVVVQDTGRDAAERDAGRDGARDEVVPDQAGRDGGGADTGAGQDEQDGTAGAGRETQRDTARAAAEKYCQEHGTLPAVRELARLCGVSSTTCGNVLKEIREGQPILRAVNG